MFETKNRKENPADIFICILFRTESLPHHQSVAVKQGWGTQLLSRAACIVYYRWRAPKSIDFILKFYLHLTMRKSDFFWITKYLLIMQLRFDGMFYSNFGNENSGVGHIKCSKSENLTVTNMFE